MSERRPRTRGEERVRQLDRVLERALDRDPARRPTVLELVDQIEAAL